MRQIALSFGVVAAVVLSSVGAEAGNPYRGYGGQNFAPNYGYQVNNFYGNGGGYPDGGWVARPYYPLSGYYQSSDPHGEAVRRIMAAHSRYRYYTHPRSTYNSPPAQADYFGWGY